MFETLLWDLGAAVQVGFDSLFGSSSTYNSDEDSDEKILAKLKEGEELENWIPYIMAMGATRSEAIDLSRVIYRALSKNKVIDPAIAEAIAKDVGMSVEITEKACICYRELTFFRNKGFGDVDSLKRITYITDRLVDPKTGKMRDITEVSREYGIDIKELNAISEMLAEYSNLYPAANSVKPFVIEEASPQQPVQQAAPRNNKKQANTKNNNGQATN